MGRLQLLLATMNQTDFSLVSKMRIQSDAIIANQGDGFAYGEKVYGERRVRMYTTTTRGAGVNRNLALLMADAEFCLIADDDVLYTDGYEACVIRAFEELPDADVILFGLLFEGDDRRATPLVRKIKKMGPFTRNPYGGPRIAFRLNSIRKANIWFTVLFGGGSRYSNGEDSYFIRECARKGLSIYTHPYVLGKTDLNASSWFSGYDEMYFFNVGAYFRMAHPAARWFFMLYHVLRVSKKEKIPKRSALRRMRDGARGFDAGLSFAEWKETKG